MGVFTLELYKVLEYTGATLDAHGQYVGGAIGLTDGPHNVAYPIYDEAHRETLNRKIIDRYLNREIGHETVERFVHAMSRKMHEVMPAYNQLYETTMLELDPFKTIDMRTVTEGTANSERETTSDSETESRAGAKSRAIRSDFPQFALAGNADYATSGDDSNATNTATGEASSKDAAVGFDESSTESRVTGYQGIPAQLLIAARSAIINIDLAIIEEISDLFMIVWDNGDDWLPSNWRGLTL